MFLSAAGPRLVIDPADSSLTAIEGAETFRDPRRFPLGAATARFVPVDPDDLDAYDAVYAAAFESFPRMVWADEAGAILPATRQPPAGRRYVVQGAKRMLGHLAVHTRPREVYRGLIANASHLLVFQLPNPDDRAHLAKMAGLSPVAFGALLDQLGEREFVWLNLTGPGIPPIICPALELR